MFVGSLNLWFVVLSFVGRLVGSFVRLFIALVELPQKVDLYDFHDIWRRCSASAPNFTVNFSAVKVKVHGYNRRIEAY